MVIQFNIPFETRGSFQSCYIKCKSCKESKSLFFHDSPNIYMDMSGFLFASGVINKNIFCDYCGDEMISIEQIKFLFSLIRLSGFITFREIFLSWGWVEFS